jgi:hypothetical protein
VEHRTRGARHERGNLVAAIANLPREVLTIEEMRE